MSSLQGVPHKGRQGEAISNPSQAREYVTVSGLGPSKTGLDVVPYAAYFDTQSTALTAASARGDYLIIAGHSARVGDIIRVLSFATQPIQIDMGVEEIVDANTIRLTGELSDATGAAVLGQIGDTVAILRPISIRANPDGSLASGPVEFLRDTGGGPVSTQVLEDTTTPTNNRPLPVKLTGIDGDVLINSNNLNIEVQLRHDTANPDSTQIGDGVQIMQVRDAAAASADEASAYVTDHLSLQELRTIVGVIPAARGQSNEAGSLSVALATEQDAALVAIQTALEILDNAATNGANDAQLRVDLINYPANLDIRDLTHVASQDSVRIGDGAQLVEVRASAAASADENSLYVTDHLVKTVLDTINAKLVDGNDIGDVTINNAGAGAAVNIQDGGNSITVDATQLDIDDLDHTTDSVRLGDGTDLSQIRAAGAASADEASLYVTDHLVIQELLAIKANQQLDIQQFIVVDFSTTNITGGGAYAEILANTSAVTKEITLTMSSGDPMYLALGAVASEANKMLIPPGGFATPVRISIPSGTRLSLTRVNAGTTSAGSMYINLLG